MWKFVECWPSSASWVHAFAELLWMQLFAYSWQLSVYSRASCSNLASERKCGGQQAREVSRGAGFSEGDRGLYVREKGIICLFDTLSVTKNVVLVHSVKERRTNGGFGLSSPNDQIPDPAAVCSLTIAESQDGTSADS